MSQTHEMVTVRGMPGLWQVLQDNGARVVVARGPLRLEVAASALTHRQQAAAPPTAKAPHQHNTTLFHETVGETLDLHGHTVNQALPLLEKFLDDAQAAGRAHVVIIHGHGTGVLEKAIRHWLKKHRYDFEPHQLSRRGFVSQKVRLG